MRKSRISDDLIAMAFRQQVPDTGLQTADRVRSVRFYTSSPGLRIKELGVQVLLGAPTHPLRRTRLAHGLENEFGFRFFGA